MGDLDSIAIKPEILALIPRQTALEFSAIPLEVNEASVTVALSSGYQPQIIEDLAFLLGKRIVPAVHPPDKITSALHRLYNVTSAEAQRTAVSSDPEFLSVREEEAPVETSSDGSVVALVNRIVSDAIRMKASDIHVEPCEKMLRVRYRLDGVLREIPRPALEKARPLISRLKIMADLDITEKRRPQDGRIRVKDGERVVDIRVSTLPTDFGEKVVLRILDKSQLQLDIAKVGFEERDLKLFQRVVRLPYGMALVTGPTGSGKTTTLYAALNHINSPEINITTIEDPIEYNLTGVNQTHVRSEIGLTFAHALRSILRQDPNVIMVGEIRDAETAEIAIRAALTGHLVFSTLHTNDAPSAVTRLIDMGVEPFLVASSIKMILAQRLVRKLCPECRIPVSPTTEQREELSIRGDEKVKYYKGKGCPACANIGYKGRIAVYELMQIRNRMCDAIAGGITTSELRTIALTGGMVTLREAALLKARRGETSLDEVMRETAKT